MNARPMLLVEMPVPVGREDEWNRWYHEVHIPDLQATVPAVVCSTRYRLLAGDDDVRYLVIHEFDSAASLLDFQSSALIARRGQAYTGLWGTERAVRLRAFTPIFELPGTS